MTDQHTLTRPEKLSDLGNAAYDRIMEYLHEKGLTNTGGCKTFYSPKEWADRGEDYGTDSLLIIVHDGGDHARAFSWDYEDYKTIEGMVETLKPLGLFPEQCTCWYSAIYK
jgi:hypothetical protein